MPATRGGSCRSGIANILLFGAIVQIPAPSAPSLRPIGATTLPRHQATALARHDNADRIFYAAGYRSDALPHDLRVRSILKVGRTLRFGEFVWNDRDVPDGPGRILVDPTLQTISVFRNGHEIGTAIILYGSDRTPTPAGTFPIIERARHHRSNLYDADMPYMLRLTMDGVAIHASSVRKGFATHGCIGIPAGFASRLFQAMRKGDLVTVLPSRPAPPGRIPPSKIRA